MAGLKPIEEVYSPDARHAPVVRIDGVTGETVPVEVSDYHERISKIVLTGTPPERVVAHFDVARNLLLYSWFVYDFSTPALAQAHASVELALKEKLKSSALEPPKNGGLKKLLKKAIGLGWLKDGGFPHLRFVGDPPIDEFDHRPAYDRAGAVYCRTLLLDSMPSLRNSIAHGSSLLIGTSGMLGPLEICAAIINQLFPPTEGPKE